MTKQEALRLLPAVHRVLADPTRGDWLGHMPPALVTEAIGEALSDLRQLWETSVPDPDWWREQCSTAAILRRARAWIDMRFAPQLREVLNLTGTVVHTNLGRAPLSARAQRLLQEVAGGYSNLEYRLAEGDRGSRHNIVAERICRLTGAEDACVVNNNAAAVLLVLRAVASGGEAIVSRGQLVEIGGSFRIPDVMTESGVKLVEVGTTNKTRIADYERALNEQTRAIVRVHTSNYRIVGFTEQPDLAELAELAHRVGVPLIEDLGSGSLFDFSSYPVGGEPVVQHSLAAGVDVVTFSGDKLLGSAQAGIICGKTEYIARIRKHPLMRALRVDKLTLAAIDATLIAYEDPELARAEIPVLHMLTASYDDVRQRAEQLCSAVRAELPVENWFTVDTVDTTSTVGGGAFPGAELPSCAVVLTPVQGSAQSLATRLRTVPRVPVISRVSHDVVLLDVRTLLSGQEEKLLASLGDVCGVDSDAGEARFHRTAGM